MFVRFRENNDRLQASLVETRRSEGRVRHEHVASFGSIDWPPSIENRIAFWQRLHERLAKLSNRVDAAAQAKILAAIHARIPMVTPDEQRALQLANVKADEHFWSTLYDLHADTVEGHKGLASAAERAVAKGQSCMGSAAQHRDAAKDRRERLERGEDVPGGLGKPLTPHDAERILRDAGVDPQYCKDVAELSELIGFDALCEQKNTAEKRAEKAIVRALLRRHREHADG